MKQNKLFDVFEHINDEYINSASEALSGRKNYSSVFGKKQLIALAAACLAIVIFAGGGIALALDVAAYNEAVAYFTGKGLSTDGLTKDDIKNIYQEEVNNAKENTSSEETSSDEPYDGSLNEYTEEETVAFVKRAVNNELWYHGEYSELYDLIGNTYTMRYFDGKSVVTVILYNSWDEHAWYIRMSVPWDEPDTEIFDMYNIWGIDRADLMDKIESKSEEAEEFGHPPALECEITFDEPEKPVYGEDAMTDEDIVLIKDSVAKALYNGGITGEVTVYVRGFVHPDSVGGTHKDCATEVFIETGNAVYVANYGATHDYSIEAEKAGVTNVRLITEYSTEYFYIRVKETTDIVLTVDIDRYVEETMSKYYEEQLIGFWHAEPGIPADYLDHYRFYSNGTFIFNYSFCDGLRRKLTEYGTWSVNGSTLTLEITAIDWLDGGEIIEDPEFIGDYIEGGTVRTEMLESPEIKVIELKDMYVDVKVYLDYTRYMTAVFGDTRYWKLSDDPHSEPAWQDVPNSYTEEEAIAFIQRAVNNNVWYHGEYSMLEHLIGNTYTMVYFEYLYEGAECVLYNNDTNTLTILTVSFPYDQSDVSADLIWVESFDSWEQMMGNVDYDPYGYTLPPISDEISFGEVTKPIYGEGERKNEEFAYIEEAVRELLAEEKIYGDVTYYVHDFYNTIGWDDYIYVVTDVFIVADGKTYFANYYGDAQNNDFTWKGTLDDLSDVSTAADNYYFEQVKATTDLVFSITVDKPEN